MKKILTVSMLAIAAVAFTHQEASAWVNSRFGIGANLDWQSGGNSLLWGLWRSGSPGQMDPQGLFQGRHFNRGYCPTPVPGAPIAPPPGAPVPPAPGGAALPVMMPYPYAPMIDPNAAAYYQQQYQQYGSPYQFATYRPVYYYPTPYYYGR